jgi:hypothetical protein
VAANDPGASAPRESRVGRNVGVGCLMTFLGLMSGGMVGVLVAYIVGKITNCVPPQGLPACDWGRYAMAGWVIGGVSLPILVLWRLRSSDAAPRNSQRG